MSSSPDATDASCVDDAIPMTVEEMRAGLIRQEALNKVQEKKLKKQAKKTAKKHVKDFTRHMRYYQTCAIKSMKTSWSQYCNHNITQEFLDELQKSLPEGLVIACAQHRFVTIGMDI